MSVIQDRLYSGARGFERFGLGLAFGGRGMGMVVKVGGTVLSIGGAACDGGRYSRREQVFRGQRHTAHEFAFGHLTDPAKRGRSVMLELA